MRVIDGPKELLKRLPHRFGVLALADCIALLQADEDHVATARYGIGAVILDAIVAGEIRLISRNEIPENVPQVPLF